MQPEQLIERGARAVRMAKYNNGGGEDRRNRPPSNVDKRYAAAAMVDLLNSLADMRLRMTPDTLRWWASEIEKAGGDL